MFPEITLQVVLAVQVLPSLSVTVNWIRYSPSVLYVCTGFCWFIVVPSPKSH